jgi:hypothetical protein
LIRYQDDLIFVGFKKARINALKRIEIICNICHESYKFKNMTDQCLQQTLKANCPGCNKNDLRVVKY